MRLAMARSRSGCTVRSFLPTMYQLGFDFQACHQPWTGLPPAEPRAAVARLAGDFQFDADQDHRRGRN
jgi:hypothetical protein